MKNINVPSECEGDFQPFEKIDRTVFDGKQKEVKELLEKELVIAVVGQVDAGKDSLIRAILGDEYGSVSPIPGWTKEVQVLSILPNVRLANTPGLEDVDQSIERKTLEFMSQADIILYLFPAVPGVTKHQLESFTKITSTGRPVLPILNKIDLVEEAHRAAVVGHAAKSLSVDDVLAISAKTGENIDAVTDWIYDVLKTEGKDILFAKVAKGKDRIINRWIIAAVSSATAIGAIPIPGSDVIPLIALQIGLILKIAHVYGYDITRENAKAILTATIAGQVGRALFRTVLKAVGTATGPLMVITSAAAAGIAGAMTYGVGKVAQAYFRAGMDMHLEDLGKMYKKYLTLHRKGEVLPENKGLKKA